MVIKRYIYSLLVVLVLPMMFACSDDDKVPTVVPTASGTVTDRDGNEYHWVRIGNLDWMTENLRCDDPYYEDVYNEKWGKNGLTLANDLETEKKYFKLFGNYYTWQEAMDNAPEGWRLPTDDDFKALEIQLGMKESDANRMGWRKGASTLMTQQGEGTMLDFRYGGEVCNFSYSNIELYHPYDYGYYWTATDTLVNNEPASIARVITPSRNAVNRLVILHEQHFMSVRYVRDAK